MKPIACCNLLCPWFPSCQADPLLWLFGGVPAQPLSPFYGYNWIMSCTNDILLYQDFEFFSKPLSEHSQGRVG